jgi:hypothetical protein
MYFVLIIYRMIECNITYVMVFFSKYYEIFVFEFFFNFIEEKKGAGSLVPELHLKFFMLVHS